MNDMDNVLVKHLFLFRNQNLTVLIKKNVYINYIHNFFFTLGQSQQKKTAECDSYVKRARHQSDGNQ